MWSTTFFILACLPLCLAAPSPTTATSLLFGTSKTLHNLQRSTLVGSDRQVGLNLFPCLSDDDCVNPRLCLALEESTQPVPCGSVVALCACLPLDPSLLFCGSSSDCEEGEVCLLLPDQTQPFCVSKTIAATTSDATVVDDVEDPVDDDGPSDDADVGTDDSVDTEDEADTSVVDEEPDTDNATPPPTTTETVTTVPPTETQSSDPDPPSSPTIVGTGTDDSDDTTSEETSTGEGPIAAEEDTTTDTTDEEPTQGGLTLDPCQESGDCQSPRECVDSGTLGVCEGGDCRCFGVQPCESDSACDEGEGCFGAEDINLPVPAEEEGQEARFCASRAAIADAVCIATHSLTHISKDQLVFETNAVAHVLCDMSNSCATPGHIVRYKGKGMMMKSYCELNGCERKVMRVNSPKYQRGLMIPSQTEDLEFTALAARFESRAEEGVLSVAVRLGF